MSSSRRDFLTALFGAASIPAATAADIALSVSRADEALIEKVLYLHGGDAVIRYMIEHETFGLLEVHRVLSRQLRKKYKATAARRRRERNQDVVVFRGPISISDEAAALVPAGRLVVSRNSGHRVERGDTQYGMRIDVQDGESLSVPAGTAWLVDQRRPLGDVPTAELISCSRRPLRLHIWQPQKRHDSFIAVLRAMNEGVENP